MMMEEEGGVKLKLFNWASDVGKQVSVLREQGKSPSALLSLQHGLSDKIIGAKIRDRFGDGSASSSPARPRSTRTSRAGSTPWACRSPRATA